MTTTGPSTISQLRDRHLALMEAWRSLGAEDDKRHQAEELRLFAKAVGKDLAGRQERDEAQGIIDYWASAIASLAGRAYPTLITLDPYEGKSAIQAWEAAQALYARLSTAEEKLYARQIFEDLLSIGSDGALRRSAPQVRSALTQRSGPANPGVFDQVLADFEASGAIVRLAGDTAENDRFEVADVTVAERWPELRGWLDSVAVHAAERSRLVLQAEAWEKGGRSTALLLPGPALATIDRHLGQSSVVDAYIRASKQRRRAVILAGAGVLSVAALALVGGSVAALFAGRLATEVGEDRTLQAQQNAPLPSDTLGNIAPPAGDNLVAGAPSAAPNAPLDQTLNGAAWLGSLNGGQQVILPAGGVPRSFADAKEGTRYRVRGNLYLRTIKPDLEGAYISKPSKAVIPSGNMIELRGPPTVYERPSGQQYWADVRVVPQVYVQYVNADRARVDELRVRLAAAGFDVPPAEEIASARGLGEIRYFLDGNLEIARALQGVINTQLDLGVGKVACTAAKSAGVTGTPFRVELWVDFARRPADRPVQPC